MTEWNSALVMTNKKTTALSLKLKLSFSFNTEWSKLSHKLPIFLKKTYSELCQTFKREQFTKTVND